MDKIKKDGREYWINLNPATSFVDEDGEKADCIMITHYHGESKTSIGVRCRNKLDNEEVKSCINYGIDQINENLKT